MKNKIDPETIATLKFLLSEAENGDLQKIMFITKHGDNKISMGWAGTPEIQMVGKIEELKFYLFSQMYLPVADE